MTTPTTTAPSIWDNPELKTGGDFITFMNVGDTVAGTIQMIRAKRWDDGSVSPELLLVTDQGDEKTVTAGQIRLKAALAEKRPEAGDHITITLTQIEKRSGGKTLKHFDVEVRGAGTPVPAAAAPAVVPAAAATPIDAAAVAAAMAALSPEQRAAMGLPAA